MVLRHSREFYGPETASQEDRDSGSTAKKTGSPQVQRNEKTPPYLLPGRLDFENPNRTFAVDLSSGGLTLSAFMQHMTHPRLLHLHILEAKLADPQTFQTPVLVGIGRKIPSTNLVLAELNLVNEFNASKLLMLAF